MWHDKLPTCPSPVWRVVAAANFDKLLNEEEDIPAIGRRSESRIEEKYSQIIMYNPKSIITKDLEIIDRTLLVVWPLYSCFISEFAFSDPSKQVNCCYPPGNGNI